MSGPAYSHRAMPGGPPGGPPGPTRLAELLDFVKHEVDALSSEATGLKNQNAEYEQHTNSHAQEVTALRVTLTELEHEHDRMKATLEEENRRLRAELEALRNGHSQPHGPSSAPVLPPTLPPPQVGHGPANLFGGLMGASSSGPPPAGGLPGPASGAMQPDGRPSYPGGSANGWNRDRDMLAGQQHPSKRIRTDEPASYDSNGASASSLHEQAPSRGPQAGLTMPPYDPRPSQLSLSRMGPIGASATPDRQRSPGPPTPNSANPINMDPAHVSREHKIEGSDWTAVFNPKVRRELNVELVQTLQHDSVVCCVRFSPDGTMLATGCNRYLHLYEAKTGRKLDSLADSTSNPGKPDNYIRSACFSPDGKFVATGAEDRIVRVWDIERKTVVSRFPGHESEIYSLAFSPDGNFLVSGSGDRSAHIWDLRSGEKRFVLTIDPEPSADGRGDDAGVTSVAVSPDGKLVAAGSLDYSVRVWDLHSGILVDRLQGHKDSVYSVAFAPDGKWLVSGSLDKSLKLWDLALLRNRQPNDPTEATMGKTLCTTTLSGHKDYVLSVAVSSDGKYIVSGSKDRSVSFWNPRSPTAVAVLQGHKNSVISIGVAERGGLLATGSGDWSCKIWRMSQPE